MRKIYHPILIISTTSPIHLTPTRYLKPVFQNLLTLPDILSVIDIDRMVAKFSAEALREINSAYVLERTRSLLCSYYSVAGFNDIDR